MDGRKPILLAEDDENDVFLLTKAFGMAKFSNPLVRVSDGQQVIAYLLGRDQYGDRVKHPYPTMILTDLKMPKMGGMELLKWLDENQALRIIPTIVLSSSADPGDVRRAYRLGANAYLVKPSNFEGWVAQVTLLKEFWNACQIPDI